MRINKYLASCGICSRRKAEEYIKAGLVKVNDIVINELAYDINEILDQVKVNDKIINLEKNKVYIMLNKPQGYITTNNEQFNRPYVLELINEKERVFPIGRLDMNTQGLLLLTNDGDFSNKIMHPSNVIYKKYIVETQYSIEEIMLQMLRSGVDIDGYVTKEAKVKKISSRRFEISICEGKNRQIRKMCDKVGIKLKKLVRVQIGPLKLGELKVGKYRYLTDNEIKQLMSC